MSRIRTDVEMTPNFIDSHWSIIQNHGTDFFNVFVFSGHGRATWPLFIGNIYATVFEHGYLIPGNFAEVKSCFHIVVKVYDGFMPFASLQPTKFV
jgi:hypothetical protein